MSSAEQSPLDITPPSTRPHGNVGAKISGVVGGIAGALTALAVLRLAAALRGSESAPHSDVVAGGVVIGGLFVILGVAFAMATGDGRAVTACLPAVYFVIIAYRADQSHFAWITSLLLWASGWPRLLTPVLAAVAWGWGAVRFVQHVHRIRAGARDHHSRSDEFDAWLLDQKRRNEKALRSGMDGRM